MNRFCLILSALLAGTLALSAQTADSTAISHQLGFDLRSGYVPATRDFLGGDNPEGKRVNATASAHLEYAFRFNPNSRIGRTYPSAYQGVGVAVNTYGYNRLGTPVAVYALQGAKIASFSPKVSLGYEWNFGASFFWKHFDAYNNPYNTVVGSSVNAYINLGFMVNWQVSDKVSLSAGVDATHFSNGNTSLPNGGVNSIGVRLGMAYNLDSHPATNALPELNIKPYISYDLTVYGAWRKKLYINLPDASIIPGNFGIIGLNFNPMYNFCKYFRAGASLDMKYDECANITDHHVDNTYDDDIKFYRQPFSERFSTGLSVRGELVMPIFAINFGIGHNIIYKGADNRGLYQILALKVSVTRNIFAHIGYQLHKFKTPNNLMLGVGYRFNAR